MIKSSKTPGHLPAVWLLTSEANWPWEVQVPLQQHTIDQALYLPLPNTPSVLNPHPLWGVSDPLNITILTTTHNFQSMKSAWCPVEILRN